MMTRMIALLLAGAALSSTTAAIAADVRQQPPVQAKQSQVLAAALESDEVPLDVPGLSRADVASTFQESATQESTKPATAKPDRANKPTPKEATPKQTTPRSTTPEKATPPQATPNPPPVSEQLQPLNNNPQFAASNQRYIGRLARSPDMFGDSFIPANARITTRDGKQTLADLPVAGGSRRFKNEYARALPTDRVFGFYHYFNNALQTQNAADQSVNRFTFGAEKTFFDGNDSIELRMPFTSHVSQATSGFSYDADGIGDLVISLKHLLYLDSDQAWALGLAVSVPTGSDLRVERRAALAGASTIDLENEAVHLVPYLAYQATPDESWFFNGYVQVDTPTNGNSVRVNDVGNTETLKVTDQTLLYLDAAVGYWWWHDEEAEFLNGLASVIEVHYTTALNNATSVTSANRAISFGDSANRFDVVNVTLGLNVALARNTQLRTACVLPLRDGTNRFFDSEFTVGLIYRR